MVVQNVTRAWEKERERENSLHSLLLGIIGLVNMHYNRACKTRKIYWTMETSSDLSDIHTMSLYLGRSNELPNWKPKLAKQRDEFTWHFFFFTALHYSGNSASSSHFNETLNKLNIFGRLSTSGASINKTVNYLLRVYYSRRMVKSDKLISSHEKNLGKCFWNLQTTCPETDRSSIDYEWNKMVHLNSVRTNCLL